MTKGRSHGRVEKRRSESSEMRRTRFAEKKIEIADFWGLWRKSSGGEESTTRWRKNEGGRFLFFFFCPTYIFTGNFPKSTRGLGKLDSFFSRSDGTKKTSDQPSAAICTELVRARLPLLSKLWWILQGSDYDNTSSWYFFTWGNEDYDGQDVQPFLRLQ